MTEHDDSVTIRRPHRQGLGATLVYGALLAMGIAVLTPCVLLPEWRVYQALCVAEQAQQYRVDSLELAVSREERRLDALRSDPAVITRLARRELSYFKPGELEIAVAAEPVAIEPHDSFVARAVEPPARIARLVSWLPRYDYDSIFCDPETRPLVIALSIALLGVAFGLFGFRGSVGGS